MSIDGESVEVDNATIHDAEKFSMACMDQISRPMLPIGKIIWRKQLVKLFANVQEVKAPDTSKGRILLAPFAFRTTAASSNP